MSEIGFGLCLIWTTREYLGGEMATIFVFQEYDPISALSHAIVFRLWVGQQLTENSLACGGCSSGLGLAQLLRNAYSFHASHLTLRHRHILICVVRFHYYYCSFYLSIFIYIRSDLIMINSHNIFYHGIMKTVYNILKYS